MRIPLDYYRILGLPIQATAEQLQQAHRDRTLQLPRREFSEAAIEARKQLIDEAYAVLSDPVRRQEYDASFLAKSYELLEVGRSPDFSTDLGSHGEANHSALDANSPDPYSPNLIDIDDEQFVGALLILHELGEYELVLKLSRPYLEGSNFALKQGRFGNPDIISADIVLTHALACLELGREQWQQGQYESAAASLQAGQEILLKEGLFPNIRGEMQADLYKLRPYRVLELVALPEHHFESRRQGLELLEDMLHDRGGIDGAGDDLSGLTVDDFLRFIQQLRSYLTAAEQQTLFEREARRPSAVATYLAVYALLARGFAERQPALIRRAKGMLLRLGTRQDVHLEQAVCSLLLGQTEEASRALELSREFESLAFIREHSQDSPDLLPGLCLYSERWLQNEVFPHFRDLARKQASLKEYFADEDVQAYLEELPNDPEPVSPWTTRRSSPTYRQPAFETPARSEPRLQTIGQGVGQDYGSNSATAMMETPNYASTSNGSGIYTAERDLPLPEENLETGYVMGSNTRSPQRDRVRRHPGHDPHPGGKVPVARRPKGRTLRVDRLLFLAALGMGIILLGVLVTRWLTRPQSASVAGEASSVAGEASLQVQPLAPVLSQVVPPSQTATLGTALDETSAASIIETWLSAKAAAMGEEHNIEPLASILTDPALSAWQERAQQVSTSNSYWVYEHSDVEVTSVEIISDADSTSATLDVEDPETAAEADPNAIAAAGEAADAVSPESEETVSSVEPEAAIVEATVTERGEFYNNGQLDQSSSYDSTLQVRYNLIRENGEWRIQSWEVLE